MTTITLNETVRSFARSNPTSLLSLIGAYAGSGKVNDLDMDKLREYVFEAHLHATTTPIIRREDFESDQAYNDQANQLVIIRALATKLSYAFTADNVPAMIEEMYDRMECHQEVWEAYMGISAATRRMENAFMDKAKAELY